MSQHVWRMSASYYLTALFENCILQRQQTTGQLQCDQGAACKTTQMYDSIPAISVDEERIFFFYILHQSIFIHRSSSLVQVNLYHWIKFYVIYQW